MYTAAEVIREVSWLPQLDLYQERKTFWDSVAREHKDKIQDFIDCLSKKYSELYSDCKGKHAYTDLQVRWHEYLRSVASSVEHGRSKRSGWSGFGRTTFIH